MKGFAVRRLGIVSLAGVVFVSGCASTGGGSHTSSGVGGCGATTYLVSGGVGALLGSAVGGKGGALKGAALGAAAAAVYCFTVKSESKETKTAQQVEQAYKQNNQGKLPDAPQVVAYNMQMSPSSGVVSKGKTVELRSYAEVINGRLQKADRVEEELILSLESDKLQTLVKPMPNVGGGFSNTHKLTVPAQFQDGTYQIASRLLINGQPVSSSVRQQKIMVVTIDGELKVALL